MKNSSLSRLTLTAVAIAIAASPLASARSWTSLDGRTFEGDFVSATDEAVTVKRSDGKTFDIPLDRLSDADRKWISEQPKSEPSTAPASAPTAPAAPPKPVEGPFAALVTGDWALSTHGDLPFALYGSTKLSGDQKHPLVVALHGKSQNSENGRQVGNWIKSFTDEENYRERPCFVVAPLCYQPFGGTGSGWSDKPGDEVIDLVETLVESLPIDKNRVYLVGYSMGGFGTCHLMEKEPKLFAAGVPVSGYGSSEGELKRKPIWLYHAANDPVVPVDGARRFAEEMKQAPNFHYTEFPAGGHSIIGRVFEDVEVHKWLFSQSNN